MEGLSCEFCLLLFSAVLFSKVNTLESLHKCAGAGATPKLIMYKLWMSCQKHTQKYTWQPYEYTEENCKQACFKNPQSLDLALLCCPAVMICIVIVFLQNMNFIDLCNVIVRNRVKWSANK